MDQINIIIALAVLFLIGFGTIVALVRQVSQLEESLEERTMSVNYYSKESLDRFEQISKLRMDLLGLKAEKAKLQDEVTSLKAKVVVNERATALTSKLEEVNQTKEVTSDLAKGTIIPTSGSLDLPTTTPVAFTQSSPRSTNKNRRKK